MNRVWVFLLLLVALPACAAVDCNAPGSTSLGSGAAAVQPAPPCGARIAPDLATFSTDGSPAEGRTITFTAQELSRILSHGPWPPVRRTDPANRIDGAADAIALGRLLFFDPRLSASGELACSSCHDPRNGFQDGRKAARHGRNTPGLRDVAQHRWFGWDGAADSLWAASLSPLTAGNELAATSQSALTYLERNPDALALYRKLFDRALQPDATLLVNLSKALAAFQSTLVSPRTRFDAFRDALASGDAAVAARYPVQARRGLKLFVGEGRCFLCHGGPLFTNGEFGDIGRPFFTTSGVDPGRWGGLQRLLASPYNRLGPFTDASPTHPSAVGTRHVAAEPRNYGEFRVPGLRGLATSAPYFHDGSAKTLEEVVAHYSELDENRIHADGARLLRALRLSPQQVADLVAFLLTLSQTPEVATQ